MGRGLIRNRPKNDREFVGITDKDKDCLAVSVAFGWGNERVYAMFHPDYLDKGGKLNSTGRRLCTQFFAYAKHKEFMDAYRQTLGSPAEKGDDDTVEISESRKDIALRKLLNKALVLVEGGGDLDPDTLKTIAELFRRLGVLKDEVEQEIKPIRILPTLCKNGCRYRLFCETSKAEGLVFDECDWCKARKFAEDMGFSYDPANVLDVPDDVIAEIDSKNDVKLADILSGKIEN